MGEAKRRGSYQERVTKAMERDQSSFSTRKIQSQIEMQEHLQQLQARRLQMESQMGPLDKLHVEQSQMLRDVADKLKQMEGAQVVSETPTSTVISIASPQSLGTVIDGEVLSRGETQTIVHVDESAFIPATENGRVTTGFEHLDNILQDGIRPDDLSVFAARPQPELSPETDSSHFDDLAPIVNESQT